MWQVLFVLNNTYLSKQQTRVFTNASIVYAHIIV